MGDSGHQPRHETALTREHHWQTRFSRVFEEATKRFLDRQAQQRARQELKDENISAPSKPLD